MTLTRIVRMEFVPEKVDDFLKLFNATKDQIRAFPGILRLELHRDVSAANVFYTLSQWRDEESLNHYRDSALFRSVWPQTKALFAGKPEAYSLRLEMEVRGKINPPSPYGNVT